jgi:hypothetical protein
MCLDDETLRFVERKEIFFKERKGIAHLIVLIFMDVHPFLNYG